MWRLRSFSPQAVGDGGTKKGGIWGSKSPKKPSPLTCRARGFAPAPVASLGGLGPKRGILGAGETLFYFFWARASREISLFGGRNPPLTLGGEREERRPKASRKPRKDGLQKKPKNPKTQENEEKSQPHKRMGRGRRSPTCGCAVSRRLLSSVIPPVPVAPWYL